ncbi:MAG: hypothetical protein ACLRW5_14985 [Faecalibacterium prausnitzii]
MFGKLSNEINGELEIAKEQKDSQNIYLGELDYEALMSCVDGELRYQPLSPYASVKRDLALVCDEAVTCGEIRRPSRKPTRSSRKSSCSIFTAVQTSARARRAWHSL